MDRSVALAVATAMMQGKKITEFDEIAKSAVAEMGNILTGNATTNLSSVGLACLITPPTIIEGKDVRVTTMDMTTISIPLYSKLGDVDVDISLKEY